MNESADKLKKKDSLFVGTEPRSIPTVSKFNPPQADALQSIGNQILTLEG